MSKDDNGSERHLFHLHPTIEPNDRGELFVVLFVRPHEIPVLAGMLGRTNLSALNNVLNFGRKFSDYSVYVRSSPTGPLEPAGFADNMSEAMDKIAEHFSDNEIESVVRGYPNPPIYI